MFIREAAPSDGLQSMKLLLRAGFVDQPSDGHGLYTYLPFGLRVLQKLCKLIRKELNDAGYTEFLAPTMQPMELWVKSGRGDAYGDERLTVKDRAGKTLVYGPTAEEIVTDLYARTARAKAASSLPLVLWNIQTKFRDEIRPKNGIMRAREFVMLDAYSFHTSAEEGLEVYKHVGQTYLQILKKLGFDPILVRADSGEIGGSLSHEIVVKSEQGESVVGVKSNGEHIFLEGDHKPGDLVETFRCIEVGHNFHLGDVYSKPMNAKFDTGSEQKFVDMGCYGIGVSRLLGAMASGDVLDWPKGFAPYEISIITEKYEEAEQLKQEINAYFGFEDVVVDCRSCSVKKKIDDSVLVGIPIQIVIKNEIVVLRKGEEVAKTTKSGAEILSILKDVMVR